MRTAGCGTARSQPGRIRFGSSNTRSPKRATLVGVPEGRPGRGLTRARPERSTTSDSPGTTTWVAGGAATATAGVDVGGATRSRAGHRGHRRRQRRGRRGDAWGADPISPPATASAPTSWPATACAQPSPRRRSVERPRARATTSAPTATTTWAQASQTTTAITLIQNPSDNPSRRTSDTRPRCGHVVGNGHPATRASAHGTPMAMASSAANAPAAWSNVESFVLIHLPP